MEMSNFAGSCSCGAVTYQVKTNPRRVVNCHCNMCRKMNGSAFSTYVAIPRAELFVTGEEHLAAYSVTENARKHYCNNCGTPLFNLNQKFPGAAMVYLGSLEEPACYTPSVNVFCESMVGWIEQLASIEKLERGA